MAGQYLSTDPNEGTPIPSGMVSGGNIDTSNRPRVKNGDGSISTVRSISINEDGKEILIPTVVNGRVVSDEEAINAYHRTGQHLGIFKNASAATAYAKQLHNEQASQLTKGYLSTDPNEGESASVGGHASDALIGKLDQLLAKPGVSGYWEDRGIGGKVWHPPGGQKFEADRVDRSVVGGIPLIGGITPEELLGVGMAGRGVKAAVSGAKSVGGKVIAGVGAAAGEALPVVKYEVVKNALEAAGVPSSVAVVLAGVASGYKRGANGAATEAAEVAPAEAAKVETPLELTRRMKAENQARQAATSPAGSASGETAPLAGPLPGPTPAGSSAKSPQQTLNEEAIARRRAEYQARQQAKPPAAEPVPPPVKPTMTAEETKAYLDMRAMGKTDEQARAAIEASRMMNALRGLKTPTAAEKRFPKGMRGRSAPPES